MLSHTVRRRTEIPDEQIMDIVEEGIEYIVNGSTHRLKSILRLIECMREGLWAEAREIHENINHYEVFEDGLYHLPDQPLQTLTERLLEIAESDIESHEGEKDPEPDPNAKPRCKLIGQDGNVFNLMGIAKKTLKQAGQMDKATEMCEKITGSAHTYDEALNIIREYVDVH